MAFGLGVKFNFVSLELYSASFEYQALSKGAGHCPRVILYFWKMRVLVIKSSIELLCSGSRNHKPVAGSVSAYLSTVSLFPFNLAVVCCCINNGLASHLWAIVEFNVGWTLAKWMLLQETAPQPKTHGPTRGLRSRRRAHTGRQAEDSCVWQLLDRVKELDFEIQTERDELAAA